MTLPRGRIEIHVTCSLQKDAYPLTAYIAGTQLKGLGHTVFSAIEDLFTTAGTGKLCRRLEQDVARAWKPAREPEP